MPNVQLTSALRKEYEDLFNGCVIRANRAAAVEQIVAQLVANKSRYKAVEAASGVPWHFIAVVHNMESSQRFDRHLHNGDPLTARTVQVPKGRPQTGNPPFTWEASATDALAFEGLGAGTDWSLAGTLYRLEAYNGWGYRRFHPHTLSPYLWSFSHHYTSGKYVRDGVWSDTAVSAQCGAAVLLRRMAELGHITFGAPAAAGPLVSAYAATKPADPAVLARARALQQWLNTFPNIFLQVDGWPGARTSDAYRLVTGHYLPGDPRS